jgi:cytochrome c oxidase cbb3-type subunit 4
MDAGTLRGLFTLIMLLLFLAICFWAWSGRRSNTFDAAARTPLEPDELEAIDRAGDRDGDGDGDRS